MEEDLKNLPHKKTYIQASNLNLKFPFGLNFVLKVSQGNKSKNLIKKT